MNYQDLNDYELISYAYENNEEATNIILKKYEPLIASIVTRMMKSCSYIGLEKSDLMQEGLIGLNHAVEYFNEQKDISFYTYAKTCIERRVISAIISAKRLKYKLLNESISLDLEEDNVTSDRFLKDNSFNPEEIVLDAETTEYLITQIRSTLTEFELQVFDLMVSSFTYREIADMLDRDKKQIDNAIQRIKTKVREKLKEINC